MVSLTSGVSMIINSTNLQKLPCEWSHSAVDTIQIGTYYQVTIRGFGALISFGCLFK